MDERNPNITHIHISAQKTNWRVNIKEILRYKDLIVLFTKRRFQLTYKQTILGPAWVFLNPLISSIIYAIVFGGIAGINTGGIPTFLFYLSSNAIWLFFSECVTKNANTFTDNADLFGKVYFPRLTVPIFNMLSAAIQFLIQMIMVLGFMVYSIVIGELTIHLERFLLLPLILLHLGLLGLGCGIIVSSLTTKYRDLRILVTFAVQLWMYATPIVYPLSFLGEGRMRTFLQINPVTAPVELFRYTVLGEGVVDGFFLMTSWIITALILIVGIRLFSRIEKTFMDTV